MVTHDPQMASNCDRIILLKDGVILDELKKGKARKRFTGKYWNGWRTYRYGKRNIREVNLNLPGSFSLHTDFSDIGISCR